MMATRYFLEQVIRKRPEISYEVCLAVLAHPLRSESQPDGRIRVWGYAFRQGEDEPRVLRVVTLDDGSTIHNAFSDRGYRGGSP